MPVEGNPEEKGDCMSRHLSILGSTQLETQIGCFSHGVLCGANEHPWLLEYYLDNLNAMGNLNSTHEELTHMLGLKAGQKEVYSSISQVNLNRYTSRHIIIKMAKVKDNKKPVKATREKSHL